MLQAIIQIHSNTCFQCLLLHVYALSCNGILDFLCSRCRMTLLLEMYIVQLGVRTFYKLLAFSPGFLLHRISFCVLYFCTVDTWCNKGTLNFWTSVCSVVETLLSAIFLKFYFSNQSINISYKSWYLRKMTRHQLEFLLICSVTSYILHY